MTDLLRALTSRGEGGSSKSFFSYMSDKAVKAGTPLTGTFELTPRCTLDCAMCYVHLKPEQMHRPELTTEQWLDLIDQACGAGMLFATVTGGECMLHPGFKAICQALFDRGIVVSILTNGTLIDEEMAKWLARYAVERVQVTVYGSSPEGYAAVTGHPEAFQKVDRALTLLKEAGVRFTTPITVIRQLIPDFKNIVHYCHEKGSIRVSVSPNLTPARPETGKECADCHMSLDEEVALLKWYYDYEGVSYEPCSIEDALSGLSEHIVTEGFACQAGKSSFTIGWDGKMMPCNAVYWLKSDPIKDGFNQAWREIRAESRKFRYPDECERCTIRRACNHCPTAHFNSNQNKIVFDEGLCCQTKRKISEGLVHV